MGKQLETLEKLLNKATRNAIGSMPNFPNEAIYRPTKQMGLGYEPMKYRATQMGIEHNTGILNKPSDIWHIAHAHMTRAHITTGRKKHTKPPKPNSPLCAS